MKNNVTFLHPAEFVRPSDEDGILSVDGAEWFVSLLRKVPDLEIDEKLCQEDWGVVVFVRRAEKKFWIGLSMWPEGEHAWLAHFHHASFSWLQKISSSGQRELKHLISDFHEVLVGDPEVSSVAWYDESDMTKSAPSGSENPGQG